MAVSEPGHHAGDPASPGRWNPGHRRRRRDGRCCRRDHIGRRCRAACDRDVAAPESTGLAADPDWDGDAVEALRAREYARLDDARPGLPRLHGRRAVRGVAAPRARGACSAPASSATRTRRARRQRRLDPPRGRGAAARSCAFLHASPDEYDVVFTANASAALRLVGEAYPFARRQPPAPDRRQPQLGQRHPRVRPGARAASRRTCRSRRPTCGSTTSRSCASSIALPGGAPSLFAYPAQSNYSGVRHPLAWIDDAQRRGWDVLLDAAAFVPGEPPRPVPVAPRLRRRSPGTRSSATRRASARSSCAARRWPGCAGRGSRAAPSASRRWSCPRHTLGEGHIGFEDGTIDYLGLPGIEIGLRHVEAIGARHDPPPGPGPDPAPAGRPAGAAPPGRVARDPPLRAAGRHRPRRHDRRSTCSTGDGEVVGFWDVEAAADATRISIRDRVLLQPGRERDRPRDHAPRTWRACSPSDTRRRIDELGRSAGQGARRRPGVGRDRDDRARRRPVRGLPASVRRRARPDGRRVPYPAVTRTVLPSGSSTSAIHASKSVRNGARRLAIARPRPAPRTSRSPPRRRRRRTPATCAPRRSARRRSGSFRTNVSSARGCARRRGPRRRPSARRRRPGTTTPRRR